jgi:hypothetical protein
MKKTGGKLQANSTGALKTGAPAKDDSPGKKAGPIDKGEKGMKMKSPMRKGR